LQLESDATTWAIYQCHFGADTPKPTRFLGNIDKEMPHSGWPTFDAEGFYSGPLGAGCGHRFHVRKLIGKTKGVWNTSPSAAYPSKLCKYLAQLLLSRFVGGRTVLDKPALSAVDGPSQVRPATEEEEDQGHTEGTEDNISPLDDDKVKEVSEDVPYNGGCSGQPISSDWDLKRARLVDGLGLCSPNRWWPSDRFVFQQTSAAGLAEDLHELVRSFVIKNVADLRQASFELAVGKMTKFPFSSEALEEVRKRWAQLLSRPDKALFKAERQPFLLELLSQTLQGLGDPDWRVLTEEVDSFSSGVPVGYDQPLPRVSAVFPPKERFRKLDDSVFMEDSANYKSADGMSHKLEEKFREEEALGRMYPTTLGALQSRFAGQKVLIAPMGALEKPDGGVRPLHDATHHVQVNNAIQFQDQLEYPGPGDPAAVVESSRLVRESCFG